MQAHVMSSTPLVHMVTQQMEYIRMKMEGAMNYSRDLAAAELAHCLETFFWKLREVSVDDACAIHELMAKSIMDEPLRRSVLETLEKKLGSANLSDDFANQNNEDAEQDVQHIVEAMQSKDCWEVYQNEKSVEIRLRRMARQLKVCGVQKPNEMSFAKATAVALCAKGTQNSPKEALANTRFNATYYHDVRAAINTRKLKMIFQNIHPKAYELRGPDRYPEKMEELQESHPVLWAQIEKEGGLHKGEFDESTMPMITYHSPCRNTRQRCAKPKKPRLLSPCASPLRKDLESQSSPPFGRVSPFPDIRGGKPIFDFGSPFEEGSRTRTSPFAPTPPSNAFKFSSDSLGSSESQPDVKGKDETDSMEKSVQ